MKQDKIDVRYFNTGEILFILVFSNITKGRSCIETQAIYFETNSTVPWFSKVAAFKLAKQISFTWSTELNKL